jgi:hypothetical protein
MKPLTSHDADRIAGQVAATGQRLTRRTGRTTALAATAGRAADWTPGIRSALGKEGAGQPGGVSDPTGEAVCNNHDEAAARWPVELAMAARRLEASALLVEKLMDRIDGHDEPRPRERTKECRNPYCHEIIETALSEYAGMDWCGPCYDYRLRNEGRDAKPDVIAARQRKRAQRDVSRPTANA